MAIPVRGSVLTRVFRHAELIEESLSDNLVVSGSSVILANLIGGSFSGNSITQVGFGSNILPAAPGNTLLSSDAYYKGIDNVSYPSPGQITFGISLDAFEANGLLLSEYGLITGNGALFSRLVRGSALTKDLSVSVVADWTIIFGGA